MAPVIILLAIVLSAVASGCAEDEPAPSGPFAVATRSLTFVDDSRQTPAFGEQPELPERTVVTDFWYPAAGDPSAPVTPDAPPAEGRGFPVIVFNHGQQGDPQQYVLAFEMWARAGYVVAAPRHPLTVTGGPGGHFVDDIEGELGDVPFVIDRIEDELADLADVDNLAVAGHSSGAIVAFGVGFNTCCHDDRVDAVLAQGLLEIPLDGEYSEDLRGTPLIIMHGTSDEYPIDQARATFDEAEPPKFFLEIPGGNHSEDFRVGPRAELSAKAALAFFDHVLKGRADALEELRALPGISMEAQ